jgi:putative phosphoribosyl transferase
MDACFRDRREAGRALVHKLRPYAGRDDVIVLALPRGGVPVGYEIASQLRAPLDVFVVRKLGVPGHGELAMGAIASGGIRVVNQDVVQYLSDAEMILDAVAAKEQPEIERREREHRDGRPMPELQGKIVILVDDGLATGATMRAGVAALRQHEVAKIVVAVPVGAPDTCREFEKEVDETICAITPDVFYGVGQFYEDFSQTTDEEVRELLAAAADELKQSRLSSEQ